MKTHYLDTFRKSTDSEIQTLLSDAESSATRWSSIKSVFYALVVGGLIYIVPIMQWNGTGQEIIFGGQSLQRVIGGVLFVVAVFGGIAVKTQSDHKQEEYMDVRVAYEVYLASKDKEAKKV